MAKKKKRTSQKSIHMEMDKVIEELEAAGIDERSYRGDTTGLGDVVEAALNKFGITEERFKNWFNLKECNCDKRKKYLNGLFTWRKYRKPD